MVLETERLIIKPTQINDAHFILKLYNTPQWINNIGDRKINNLDDAKNYITDKMISQYKKLGYSNYTVIRKSDSKKIGTCGLYKRKNSEAIDLGFAFLPKFQKKGYAFESTKKIVEIAFAIHNLNSLKAVTIKENISSQKLLHKLRFKQ
jgi:RimJ/RimL family protein N-acetyltransferase